MWKILLYDRFFTYVSYSFTKYCVTTYIKNCIMSGSQQRHTNVIKVQLIKCNTFKGDLIFKINDIKCNTIKGDLLYKINDLNLIFNKRC